MIVFALIAAAGVVVSAFSVVLVIVRLASFGRPWVVAPIVTTLVLPLTGPARSLGALIAALERQTLRPRRVIISVESEDDPAFAQATAIAGTAGLPIQVIVAGLADRQAQKCRNQLAALDLIDDEDQAIVLFDGDIMPTATWLATLIAPIAENSAQMSTGQRWQQVTRHRAGAHVVAMIDRAAFLLPRFRARIVRVIWGGTIAFSKEAAGKLRLKDYLGKAVTDDLSLVDAAKAAGLRIATPPELLVPTPNAHGLASGWRFGRRQYLIVNVYRPWLWRLAATVILVRSAAWLVVLSHWRTDNGVFWAGVAMTLLAAVKQGLIGFYGRRAGLPDPLPVAAMQLLLGFAQAATDLYHLSMILGAAWTRHMIWGHVTYRIDGPYDIKVVARTPHAGG